MSNGASNKWIGDEYSQLLVEQIAVIVSKEKTCTDYLSGLPKMNTDYLIDEVWRQKAAEWMFKVIDFYVSSSGVYLCLLVCHRDVFSFAIHSSTLIGS